jgi:hypothetical protein
VSHVTLAQTEGDASIWRGIDSIPWGFPDKLTKHGYGWYSGTSKEKGSPNVLGGNAFMRPFDSYFAAFSVSIRTAKDTEKYATQKKGSGTLPFWFQLQNAVDLPLDSIRVVPPPGFVVTSISPDDLRQYTIDLEEHAFLSESCDVFLFRLDREKVEVWFVCFLLLFAFFPVVLFVVGGLTRGFELLGTIASLGLIRLIVVGDERAPFFVDVLFGLVLFCIAVFVLYSELRSTRRQIANDNATPAPTAANWRRWPRPRR